MIYLMKRMSVHSVGGRLGSKQTFVTRCSQISAQNTWNVFPEPFFIYFFYIEVLHSPILVFTPECVSLYHCLSLLVLSSGTSRPLSVWTARSGQQVPNHSHVTLPVCCWILARLLTASLFSLSCVTLFNTPVCVHTVHPSLSLPMPALPSRACTSDTTACYQFMIYYFLQT